MFNREFSIYGSVDSKANVFHSEFSKPEASPAHLLIFGGGHRVVSGGSCQVGGVGAGVDPGRARIPNLGILAFETD